MGKASLWAHWTLTAEQEEEDTEGSRGGTRLEERIMNLWNLIFKFERCGVLGSDIVTTCIFNDQAEFSVFYIF